MILSGIDPYTTLVDPLWTRRPRGIVEAVTPLTPDAATVTVRTNRAWPGHLAGQHVSVGIDIDGVRHHRTYSFTSAAAGPGRQLVELAIGRVEGGRVSTVLTSPAAVGTLVHLAGPTGRAVHRPARDLLLLSGGSGITPTMSILRTLAATPGPTVDVVVVHHAPTPERCMFGAELDRLESQHPWLTVHRIHTQAGDARIDAGQLTAWCPDWAAREARVCGPADLAEFAVGLWSREGSPDRLHTDPFTAAEPPALLDDLPAGAVTARFAASGTDTATTTTTHLLDAAEAAGVLAPSGCRRGVCHTCSTRLVEGTTVDVRDGRTSGAGTHVQLCVNAPLTDVVLDI